MRHWSPSPSRVPFHLTPVVSSHWFWCLTDLELFFMLAFSPWAHLSLSGSWNPSLWCPSWSWNKTFPSSEKDWNGRWKSKEDLESIIKGGYRWTYGMDLFFWNGKSGGEGQLRESDITQENKRAQDVGKTGPEASGRLQMFWVIKSIDQSDLRTERGFICEGRWSVCISNNLWYSAHLLLCEQPANWKVLWWSQWAWAPWTEAILLRLMKLRYGFLTNLRKNVNKMLT